MIMKNLLAGMAIALASNFIVMPLLKRTGVV